MKRQHYVSTARALDRETTKTKAMNCTSGNRIASLDGLRALSILFVILGHMYQYVVGLSIFGVHIFFVISGYLITTLLQKEYERNGSVSVKDFYRRRCFRILPAAYTYIG